MKKRLFILLAAAVTLSGCSNEFNQVYKSQDYDYKYEYAKECFATGKFVRAATLLEEMVTLLKGTDNAQESLYLLGMSQYNSSDFESASMTFKKFCKSYPRSVFAERAQFYVGESLYESAPEPRLDQSPTNGAITAYQEFLDLYPESPLRSEAQEKLFELQDKIITKELLSAQLYYNLGGYFGNINSNNESNYTAAIITAQNALKNYPFTSMREDFARIVMKSKFQLAENSSEEKRMDRYRDAEDECYGFINEFPDSEDKALAEKYIERCKKQLKE